jgi:hypothetical protein
VTEAAPGRLDLGRAGGQGDTSGQASPGRRDQRSAGQLGGDRARQAGRDDSAGRQQLGRLGDLLQALADDAARVGEDVGELEALLLDVAQRGLDLFEVADRRLILADVLEQIDVAGFLVLFGEPADRLPVLVDVGVDPLGCLAELVEAVVRFAGGLVDPVEVVRCLIGAPGRLRR